MRRRLIPVLMLALLPVTACASGGGGNGSAGSARDVITAEEIEAISVTTAYDAIQRLRPTFLRARGANSFTSGDSGRPVVYVNGIRSGEIEVLQQIPAQTVLDIQYLNASEATQRFGTGNAGGAILVRTRSGD
jgi:hypothetical protein